MPHKKKDLVEFSYHLKMENKNEMKVLLALGQLFDTVTVT